MFPTTKPSNSSSFSFVQSNSVQSQFNALTNDRETFRREKEIAIQNQQLSQFHLQQLKKEQVECLADIRKTQEELGDLTRKQTLLKQEQARLSRVMDSERKALENCALHTKNLYNKEYVLTSQYCKDMDLHNDETADAQQRLINKKVHKFLSVESVEAVVLGKLPDKMNVDDRNPFSFGESFELMKEAKGTWEQEIGRYYHTKAKYEDMESASGTRTGDLATPGQVDLGNVMQSQQMDLFYGETNTTE